MLTDTDFKRIQKLVAPLATKEDIQEWRSETADLKESVQELSVSIDKLAKVIDTLGEEYAAIKVQQNRHGEWIGKLATKSKVSLS